MPQIPIYQSQVSPGVAAQDEPKATPAAFGSQVADAAGTAVDDAVAMRAQANALAAKRAKENASADASVKVANNLGDSAMYVQAARASVAPGGAGHLDGVLQDFDARADKITASITDPAAASAARVQLAQQRAGLIEREGTWQAGQEANKLATDVAGTTSGAANALRIAPNWNDLNGALNAAKTTIDGLNVDGDTKTKLTSQSHATLTRSFVEGLTDKDPYAAKAVLASGQLGDLLPAETFNTLDHEADSRIKGIEAAKVAAAKAAEAEAHRQQAEARTEARLANAATVERVRALADTVNDGGFVAPADIGAAATAAARAGNPELGHRVALLGIASATNTALKGRSPQEVAGAIDGLQTKVNNAGTSASTADQVALKTARTYAATLARDVATDPLNRAARDGVINLAPVDPSNPATLAQRSRDAAVVALRYGHPVAPLTPDETASIKGTLASGSPQQQLTALQQLSGFGGYRSAAVRQVTDGDPFHGHLGLLLGTPTGAATARDALIGAPIAAANPDIFKGGDRTTALSGYVGSALSALPDLQASLPKVADALYATRSQRAGAHAWDSAAYLANVNAALGAVKDPSGTVRGGLGWHGNDRVLLPTGVSQEEFDAAAAAVPSHATYGNGQPVPDAVLHAAPLRTVGDGRYQYVADPRTGSVFTMKNGQPFTVTIGHKPPVSR